MVNAVIRSPALDLYKLDVGCVPERGTGIQTAEVGDSLIILDTNEDKLYRLHSTAKLLWECLDGSSSIQDVVNKIGNDWGADPAVVMLHVMDFTLRMVQEGLLSLPTPAAHR